jgi:hypothetical protein
MANILSPVKELMQRTYSIHGSLRQYIILADARKKHSNKENILLEWKEKDSVMEAWFPRNKVIYLSRLTEKGWCYAVDMCYIN